MTLFNIQNGTGAQVRAAINSILNTFNIANGFVVLDGDAKLPAVDGSQLINLPIVEGSSLPLACSAGSITSNIGTILKAQNAGCFLVGNTVYLYGGTNADSHDGTNSIYSFNLDTKEGLTLGTMVSPGHLAPIAIEAPDAYYLIGGNTDAFSSTSGIYKANKVNFDPESFVKIGDFPVSTRNSGHAYDDATGNVYVFVYGSTEVYRANISDMTNWSLVGNFPSALSSASAIVLDNKLYVYGSTFTGATTDASIYVADLSQPTLSFTTSPNVVSRQGTGASLIRVDDTLYMFGGLMSNSYNNGIQDISKASVSNPEIWEKIGDLPRGFFDSNVVVYNDDIYALGGGSEFSDPDITAIYRVLVIQGIPYPASPKDGDAVIDISSGTSALKVYYKGYWI